MVSTLKEFRLAGSAIVGKEPVNERVSSFVMALEAPNVLRYQARQPIINPLLRRMDLGIWTAMA
jgi:hypothetical protein